MTYNVIYQNDYFFLYFSSLDLYHYPQDKIMNKKKLSACIIKKDDINLKGSLSLLIINFMIFNP